MVIPRYGLPSKNIKDASIAAAPIALLMDGMDGIVSFWANSYWMCLRTSTICFVAGVLAWVRDHLPYHFADITGWHGHRTPPKYKCYHTQHVFCWTSTFYFGKIWLISIQPSWNQNITVGFKDEAALISQRRVGNLEVIPELSLLMLPIDSRDRFREVILDNFLT